MVGMTSALREIIISVQLTYYTFSDSACRITTILLVGGVIQACYSLVALVFDQFLIITKPLTYNMVMTRKRAFLLVFAIKFIGFFNIILTTIVWDTSGPCTYFLNLPPWHHLTTFILLIGFPLPVILSLQGHTMYIAWKHMQAIKHSQVVPFDSPTANINHTESIRKVITTTLILLCLIMSWLPLGLFTLATFFDLNLYIVTSGQTVLEYASLFYFSYGLWIPIIYGLRSPELKNFAHQFVCKKPCSE